MQKKETDATAKASPNSEKTHNKYEPQKDKLNKLKGVVAVTNEAITRATKSNVNEEKTYMDTLVSCDIFMCGYNVCIYLNLSQFLYVDS